MSQGMDRRQCLLAAGLGGLGALAGAASARALPVGAPRLRIAFGSCAKQTKPQPIWAAVRAAQPDLFLFLGDNFYADARDEALLRRRYAEFAATKELQAFRRDVPHLAIWDDHDYGDDDEGADYPLKTLSQRLFCDAWGEAPDSPRRRRDGIYEAYRIERAGRVVQIILLDLRFNRSAPTVDPARKTGYEAMFAKAKRSGEPMPGWYVASDDPTATLLGEAQWAWLAERLAEPADLRLLASPIQFAAEGSGWECWANFPHERERLAALIRAKQAEGLVVLSGDMHYAELSRWQSPGLYPLWDLTSSGLTEVWDIPTPNRRRVSKVFAEQNFGLVDIDFATPMPTLLLAVHDVHGKPLLQQRITLDQLRLSAP
jgi:alkaline phosphatase D